MSDLDDLLAALPKPKTPETEGLPTLTPEGLLAFVKANLNEKGRCPWDRVVRAYQSADCHVDTIEEVLNKAMDDGLLYEPILGVLAVV